MLYGGTDLYNITSAKSRRIVFFPKDGVGRRWTTMETH